MGHSWAPALFGIEYCQMVRLWNSSLRQRALLTRDPITHTMTDLGVQLFVDDIGRMYVQERGQKLDELVADTVVGAKDLEHRMQEAGCKLNAGKGVTLLGLRSAFSKKIIRSCTSGERPVYGTPAKYARYLGAQLGATPDVRQEVASRIRQLRAAWR